MAASLILELICAPQKSTGGIWRGLESRKSDSHIASRRAQDSLARCRLVSMLLNFEDVAMSENSVLNPVVSVLQPPIILPGQPPLRCVDEGVMPFRREQIDRDPESAVDAPQRWPRVFPGL